MIIGQDIPKLSLKC